MCFPRDHFAKVAVDPLPVPTTTVSGGEGELHVASFCAVKSENTLMSSPSETGP
jgi:hypothetical protein